jgi:hypothetical protein
VCVRSKPITLRQHQADDSSESGAVKLEQRKLEEMMFRQQKELEGMIAYEIHLTEQHERQTKKMAARKAKEDAMEQAKLDQKRNIELKKVHMHIFAYIYT